MEFSDLCEPCLLCGLFLNQDGILGYIWTIIGVCKIFDVKNQCLY